jgi:hypothetical protein
MISISWFVGPSLIFPLVAANPISKRILKTKAFMLLFKSAHLLQQQRMMF